MNKGNRSGLEIRCAKLETRTILQKARNLRVCYSRIGKLVHKQIACLESLEIVYSQIDEFYFKDRLKRLWITDSTIGKLAAVDSEPLFEDGVLNLDVLSENLNVFVGIGMNLREVRYTKVIPNIDQFVIFRNNVQDINFLRFLENVKLLNLRSNDIKTFEGFTFNRLEVLNLSNNPLAVFNNLTLPKLRELYLEDTNLKELVFDSGLESLSVVGSAELEWFEGNLPNIKKLSVHATKIRVIPFTMNPGCKIHTDAFIKLAVRSHHRFVDVEVNTLPLPIAEEIVPQLAIV